MEKKLFGFEIESAEDSNEGSCLQGYITRNVSFETLKKLFGEGIEGDGGKVQWEWLVRIDGVFCTIYDWKTCVAPEENTSWNIGGGSKHSAEKVNAVIQAYFDNKGNIIDRLFGGRE